MKKRILVLLCAGILVCGVACGKQDTDNIETVITLKSGESTGHSTDTTMMTETVAANTTASSAQSTTSAVDESKSTDMTAATTVYEDMTKDSDKKDELTEQTTFVFNTDNIVRVTLYAYYGQGRGSEVPAEYMPAIVNWLGTFSIDKQVTGDVPPGTNTYHAEIEYSDGTVIKQGLDVVLVDGVAYYVKNAGAPACFMDIISKTSYIY